MQSTGLMGLWIKAFLWIAVVLLPGGILLVPVLIGFHERDRRRRLRAPAAVERPPQA